MTSIHLVNALLGIPFLSAAKLFFLFALTASFVLLAIGAATRTLGPAAKVVGLQYGFGGLAAAGSALTTWVLGIDSTGVALATGSLMAFAVGAVAMLAIAK